MNGGSLFVLRLTALLRGLHTIFVKRGSPKLKLLPGVYRRVRWVCAPVDCCTRWRSPGCQFILEVARSESIEVKEMKMGINVRELVAAVGIKELPAGSSTSRDIGVSWIFSKVQA